MLQENLYSSEKNGDEKMQDPICSQNLLSLHEMNILLTSYEHIFQFHLDQNYFTQNQKGPNKISIFFIWFVGVGVASCHVT